MTKVEIERGNFLNPEQKRIKSNAVTALLEIIHSLLINETAEFDDQARSDLIDSVIIMFNREVLTILLTCIVIVDKSITKLNVLDSILAHIRQQVALNLSDEPIKGTIQ